MKTFADLPLMPQIQKALDVLGFTNPTEIQEKAIPLLLEKKTDIHAQAQTGTGKTLAFGIPLLHAVDPKERSVQALIMAPTRELVLQIYESLRDVSRNTGIAIEPVYGGMPIERQITNIKRGAQIIIGTPGRLNDHLRRKTLSLKNLKILVLDEADIMLDMGFKEEMDAILKHAPKDRQIWLFSATVMSGIKQLIKSHMKDVQTVKATAKSVVSSQVEQYYCVVPMAKRIAATARFIESAPDFYGIIFCRTKLLTSEVRDALASQGFRVDCLHGDMKQALRNKVIKGFKQKDFNILVATDVAARGIDVTNLTHVINFSLPEEFESYIHRIGRTGRAGKEGVAIVFVSPAEVHKVKRLERSANTKLKEIPVPALDAIINIKMRAASDFIEQSKKPDKKFSDIHQSIKEMIESFTQDEVKDAFAAALEDKFFKDVVHENLSGFGGSGTSYPEEICIDLGRDTGFSEDMMRNYLYTTCKLLPQEVNKVRVLNNKTFISIPENRLQECMNLMKKNPITKQKHKVYLVEDRFDKKREGRGRTRSGFRGHRSGQRKSGKSRQTKRRR